MRIRSLIGILLLGSAAATSGCTDRQDSPLAPAQTASHAPALAAAPTTRVSVLQRLKPLAEDVSVSQEFGKNGGVIRIPEAGLYVVVPGNAVQLPAGQKSVTITVTALKGSNVAYTFEPHGLQFRKEIRAVQDARATNLQVRRGGKVRGSYFPDRSFLGQGTANVAEFRPTEYNQLGALVTWTIDHFSGYLVACD